VTSPPLSSFVASPAEREGRLEHGEITPKVSPWV